MDQTVIEVTNIPDARVGDEVTFIGEQPPEQITADEVAGWANTISYEILTALPSQLPRIYLSSPQKE
jgi:alanine racemase